MEPAESAVLSGSKPGPHRIQGIGAGFVPDVLDTDLIDSIETIEDDEAVAMQKQVAQKLGLFTGISAGANVAAARKVAARHDNEGLVVTVMCDTGERYLSLNLFY